MLQGPCRGVGVGVYCIVLYFIGVLKSDGLATPTVGTGKSY